MTVFRTFLRVLNRCKLPVILYTVLLVAFGGFNMQTNDSQPGFTASRPDILIINRDQNAGITKSLVGYMTDNCNIVTVKNEEEAISDALFYRDVNYILYIPEHYGDDFRDGRKPEIEVKSTGDYQASYAEMLLSRYLKVAEIYAEFIDDEQTLVNRIEQTLSKQTDVEVTSRLDTDQLSKAAFYFNFATYLSLIHI